MIPYSTQTITENDIRAVVDVLNANFLTQGPKVPCFEKAVAEYCGAHFGVATNSATSALHISCLALELKEGDILWTSPNSFVASANCGLYCNATIDFVDINLKTYNLSADKLEKKLKKAKIDNKLPKIVIPVHFAGQSCNMKKIYELSKEYNFKIIEDASHAIGGQYLGKKIGSCQYSHITVFSFHPVKIITTLEGGLATTNDPELAQRMKMLRSHGITREEKFMDKVSEGSWYYQQTTLGFNYRMNDVQAALGISQLKHINEFISRRHEIKNTYDISLKNIPVIIPYQDPDCFSSMHLYPIQIKIEKTKKNRKEIFDLLRSFNIGVNVHYIPIHTQPYFSKNKFKNKFKNAEKFYNRALSLPIYPTMTTDDQKYVNETLKKVIE